MKAIVLDAETVVSRVIRTKVNKEEEEIIDGSPHNPNNGLVCVDYRIIEIPDLDFYGPPSIGLDNLSWFRHNEVQVADSPEALQAALDSADILVAHNAKFDVEYLLESGFRIPPKVWCTMIGEYILARGTIRKLSLADTAKRRKTPTQKRGDLVEEMFKDGIGYEAMPKEIVTEYIQADVLSCAEIFLQQWWEFHDAEQTRNLINIVDLMNEMLLFLVEIQRNGLKIDTEALARVKADYEAEQAQLKHDLNALVATVMGDTPINLNSGADVSMVVYSRKVINRDLHQKTFNIGLDENGNEQYAPRMSPSAFANAVRTTTKRVEKTVAINCPACNGNKRIRKIRKDGTPFKNEQSCSRCEGRGFLLEGLGTVAGFKLSPDGPHSASINGFKVGADDLDRLIDQARQRDNLDAEAFLTKKKRLNAINTYLNSFVGGIERWTRGNRILHANFNQCVARTGRLSSTDPNFQNQPKGRKFPIRRVVISRWEDIGGLILEADFSGLEFVVAGELSRDSQIISDILNRKDVHTQTARIVYQIPEEDYDKYDFKGEHKWMRDENKPYTFAPLYGSTGANEPDHIRRYMEQFWTIYPEHQDWQFRMMDEVIKNGYIATPSGREYMFPGTRRTRGRQTTNATNIKNYPIQGFATGDIVPLACIRAFRKFKELNLRSLLVLTVHDSIVVDVYPGEVEQVKSALIWAMTGVSEEIKERWNYEMALPMRMEMAIGPNWGELEEIKH